MKTIWFSLVAWLMLAGAASAQLLGPPQVITVIDSGTACVTAPAACASFDASTSVAVTFSVSGTFSATLTAEATADGSTWRTVTVYNANGGTASTTITSGGNYSVNNVGLIKVRLRATGFVSGAATVTGTRGYGVFSKNAPGFPASGGVGDILYFNTTTTVTGLPDVDAGQVLASGGVGAAPAYSAQPTLLGVIGNSTNGVFCLGGSSVAFPGFKRNGTSIQLRTCTDSAFASYQALNYQAEASGFFYFDTRSSIRSQANGTLTLENANQNAGVTLGFTTDAVMLLKDRANSGAAGIGYASLAVSGTAPASAGLTFCGTPTVTASNGTAAFTINVGTTCVTSVGTITFPAATTGWVVYCANVTAPASNVPSQTGGSTTTATLTNYARTTGLAANWTDSNILRCTATGY